MISIFRDLKFGVRMLCKNPGMTVVIVLTLALGIGANTALFSVMNTLLLRMLPVHHPNELYFLSMDGNPTFNYPIFKHLKDENQSQPGMFAVSEGTSRRRMVALDMGGKETEFIHTLDATGDFFSVLGVSAHVGRVFTASDDQEGNSNPVCVISYNFWKNRFGGDSSIVGKNITVDDYPLTIIGVTPPGFFGVEVGSSPDLWFPMQLIPQIDTVLASERFGNFYWWLRVMTRVPENLDSKTVQVELNTVFRRHLLEDYETRKAEGNAKNEDPPQTILAMQPGGIGWTEMRRQFNQPLRILMAMVGVVLLIACVNVANLLLARASTRTKEFSVRSAMGAVRFQLIRQLLTESLMLCVLGGALGLLFAQWGAQMLLYIMNVHIDPVSFNISLDSKVLLFTTAVSLFTGMLFGLIPAIRGSRLDLASSLKDSAGVITGQLSGQRLQKAMVTVQVALSLVLLIGAGLFIRTLDNLKSMDPGFNRENVELFNFDFTKEMEKPQKTAFYRNLLEKLHTIPGVQTASFSVFQPLTRAAWTSQIMTDGYEAKPDERLYCFGMSVGPDYFKTMGITLLRGREFDNRENQLIDPTNDQALRKIVINESLAKKYFGDEDPVGNYLYFVRNPERKIEIIGVVEDVKYSSLRDANRLIFYMPFFQEPQDWGMNFVLRTQKGFHIPLTQIQKAVHEVEPLALVRNLQTMDDVVDGSLQQEWIITQLGGFFSVVALFLACLGLYGVLSFSVTQRTREIGVRVALGAQPHTVLSLIIGQGIRLALIGLLLGLFAAFLSTRMVSNMLYGVEAFDLLTFISISFLLLVVVIVASYIPARRATKINPMTALRCE